MLKVRAKRSLGLLVPKARTHTLQEASGKYLHDLALAQHGFRPSFFLRVMSDAKRSPWVVEITLANTLVVASRLAWNSPLVYDTTSVETRKQLQPASGFLLHLQCTSCGSLSEPVSMAATEEHLPVTWALGTLPLVSKSHAQVLVYTGTDG
jgi:hypothetical protein